MTNKELKHQGSKAVIARALNIVKTGLQLQGKLPSVKETPLTTHSLDELKGWVASGP